MPYAYGVGPFKGSSDPDPDPDPDPGPDTIVLRTKHPLPPWVVPILSALFVAIIVAFVVRARQQ